MMTRRRSYHTCETGFSAFEHTLLLSSTPCCDPSRCHHKARIVSIVSPLPPLHTLLLTPLLASMRLLFLVRVGVSLVWVCDGSLKLTQFTPVSTQTTTLFDYNCIIFIIVNVDQFDNEYDINTSQLPVASTVDVGTATTRTHAKFSE